MVLVERVFDLQVLLQLVDAVKSLVTQTTLERLLLFVPIHMVS